MGAVAFGKVAVVVGAVAFGKVAAVVGAVSFGKVAVVVGTGTVAVSERGALANFVNRFFNW